MMNRQSMRVVLLSLAVAISASVTAVPSVLADSAVVLPKNYFYVNAETRLGLPTDEKFDSNGNTVALGSDFSRDLNSQVFTGLQPLNPFVGGTANLGTSQVDITRSVNQFRPLLAYGATDRLTLGVIIPYVWASNDVNANIDSSTANVGITSIASPFGPAGSIAPIALVPGTRAATVQDINSLLGSQFGIKPVQSWSGSGLGDIEFGGRYQYYRSDYWRLAFTGIAIAPTGKQDDPDNLVDIPLGDGNWAARFQFQQDFTMQQDGISKNLGYPTPGSFYVNTKFEYLYNASDSRTARVCSPLQPVCNQRGTVHRSAGDIVEAELQGYLGVLTDGLILTSGYTYTHQYTSSYSGNDGFDYSVLAINSDHTIHEAFIGLTFTSVPGYVQKRFPLPIFANASYRNRFAGENVAKSDWVYLTLSVYF